MKRAWLIRFFLATVACGGGQTGPQQIVGHYRLSLVNGSRMPIGDGEHLFTNGGFEIHEDGTWCVEIDWRGNLYSRVSGDRGTLTASENDLSFLPDAPENPAF